MSRMGTCTHTLFNPRRRRHKPGKEGRRARRLSSILLSSARLLCLWNAPFLLVERWNQRYGAWLFAKRGYRFLFVESRGTREEGRVIFDEFLCQFESEKGDIFFFLSFILLLSTPAEKRSRRWRNRSFRFAPLNAYSLFLRSFLFAFIREDNNVIEGGRNESSGRD